ncbi:MAG TPA: neutral zinc metallopeptidase [Acidimicrobiia bacterium]|nr:neutral zinc metallopeptidase [Acidimicrobiia bacterium]
MVRFKKEPISKGLDDRRGQTAPRRGVAIGGGAGGIILIVVLLVSWLGGGGVNLESLDEITDALAPSQQAPVNEGTLDPETDPYADLKTYMNAVYIDLDGMWSNIFAEAGRGDYRAPGFVIFEAFTNSACGGADEAVGPHYCPLDEKIYIDLDFFTQLREQFGAEGDFAPAYVIAHEFGHHIQTVLGVSDQVRALQQENPDQANELSILMELQADCFAGVWASTLAVGTDTGETIELDPGEIQEAIEAASAVGDDRIQGQVTGQVNPETWTHGSAEQRADWTLAGYESGDPASCDTFSAEG